MKVSEVKRKINSLQYCLDNMSRLLEYSRNHTEEDEKLMGKAGMDCVPRNLYSAVAETLRGEIRRLEKAVDDADIQV